jgi:FkbM family methyltransferase
MTKFFLKVLRRLHLLDFLNATFAHSINGKKFRIPVRAGVGFELFFEKESWMAYTISKLLPLKSSSVFVDVGVNLGQTLLAVKSVNESIQYIGFEPNPICVAYLDVLKKVNRLSANIYPVGLSDATGIVVLYKDPNLIGDSSATIVEKFREIADREKVFVPVFGSDSLRFLNEVKLGILKIDVEGAELEVLKSLQQFVLKDRPFIICEVLPVYNHENVFRLERQLQLEQILKAARYSINRIKPGHKLHELDQIGIHGEVKDSNYIFVPEELQEKVEKIF